TASTGARAASALCFRGGVQSSGEGTATASRLWRDVTGVHVSGNRETRSARRKLRSGLHSPVRQRGQTLFQDLKSRHTGRLGIRLDQIPRGVRVVVSEIAT